MDLFQRHFSQCFRFYCHCVWNYPKYDTDFNLSLLRYLHITFHCHLWRTFWWNCSFLGNYVQFYFVLKLVAVNNSSLGGIAFTFALRMCERTWMSRPSIGTLLCFFLNCERHIVIVTMTTSLATQSLNTEYLFAMNYIHEIQISNFISGT